MTCLPQLSKFINLTTVDQNSDSATRDAATIAYTFMAPNELELDVCRDFRWGGIGQREERGVLACLVPPVPGG
jgi:hypothetical protein